MDERAGTEENQAVRDLLSLLRKAHISTGRVEAEDVLLMAIREFGVAPRRDDRGEILRRSDPVMSPASPGRLLTLFRVRDR